MNDRNRRYAAIFAALFTLTAAFGQETADKIQIFGFVSQGFIKSTGNNWLVADTKSGSWEFSEAALTILTSPADRLRIGLQVFARDFGPEGNHEVVIDWAYGDYRLRDFFGIRIGRIKREGGLYSSIRDIDAARNIALLPQTIYSERARNLWLATNGIGFYGNISAGFMGGFDYDLYAGSSNDDPNSVMWKQYAASAANEMAMGMNATGLTAVVNSSRTLSINWRMNYGGSLYWNTPLPGLRLGATYSRRTFDVDWEIDLSLTMPGVPMPIGMIVPISMTSEGGDRVWLSGEFAWKNLTLQGEYLRRKDDLTITVSQPTGDQVGVDIQESEAFFGLISYRLTPWLALSSYYTEFYPRIEDKEGNRPASLGYPAHSGWHKEWCLSTRIDITRHWLIKLEYHKVDGTADTETFFNPDGLKKDLGAFIFKNTFVF